MIDKLQEEECWEEKEHNSEEFTEEEVEKAVIEEPKKSLKERIKEGFVSALVSGAVALTPTSVIPTYIFSKYGLGKKEEQIKYAEATFLTEKERKIHEKMWENVNLEKFYSSLSENLENNKSELELKDPENCFVTFIPPNVKKEIKKLQKANLKIKILKYNGDFAGRSSYFGICGSSPIKYEFAQADEDEKIDINLSNLGKIHQFFFGKEDNVDLSSYSGAPSSPSWSGFDLFILQQVSESYKPEPRIDQERLDKQKKPMFKRAFAKPEKSYQFDKPIPKQNNYKNKV